MEETKWHLLKLLLFEFHPPLLSCHFHLSFGPQNVDVNAGQEKKRSKEEVHVEQLQVPGFLPIAKLSVFTYNIV